MTSYCTTADVIAQLNATEAALATANSALLSSKIEAVSREIDDFCGRWFHVITGDRLLSPVDGNRIVLFNQTPPLDCLELTALAVDADGDGIFETAWEAGDWQLWPFDDSPKSRIVRSPSCSKSFVLSDLAPTVKATGKWGFAAAVPVRVKECAIALAAIDWKQRGGLEMKSEAFGADYRFTRASEQDREDLKRRCLREYVRA